MTHQEPGSSVARVALVFVLLVALLPGTGCSDGEAYDPSVIEMVSIEPGTFTMSSPEGEVGQTDYTSVR
jgi:hypothetical protein